MTTVTVPYNTERWLRSLITGKAVDDVSFWNAENPVNSLPFFQAVLFIAATLLARPNESNQKEIELVSWYHDSILATRS